MSQNTSAVGSNLGPMKLKLTGSGKEVLLSQLTAHQPTLVVFARHQDCPFCQIHVSRLIANKDRIGRIVVIGFEGWRRLTEVADGLPFEFVCASDPGREAYELVGARKIRTPLFLARPDAMWVLGKHVLKGNPLVRQGGDLSQLGADVVVDAAGRVTWSHVSSSPADRPSVDEIIEQMQQARTSLSMTA